MEALHYPFKTSLTLACALDTRARGDGTGFDALPSTLAIQYEVLISPPRTLLLGSPDSDVKFCCKCPSSVSATSTSPTDGGGQHEAKASLQKCASMAQAANGMVSRNLLCDRYAACSLLYESSPCPPAQARVRHKCGLAPSRTKVLSKTSLTCPTTQSQALLPHFAL